MSRAKHHMHPVHGMVSVVKTVTRHDREYVVCEVASNTVHEGDDLCLLLPVDGFDDAMVDRPTRDAANAALAILDGTTEVEDVVGAKEWRSRVSLLQSCIGRYDLVELATVHVGLARMKSRSMAIQREAGKIRLALAGGIAVGRRWKFSTALRAVDAADDLFSDRGETDNAAAA